jgi:hypothetical protein
MSISSSRVIVVAIGANAFSIVSTTSSFPIGLKSLISFDTIDLTRLVFLEGKTVISSPTFISPLAIVPENPL